MSRPYAELYQDELILRDFLATDRTILANERTFLAYMRTMLAFVVGGISFIKMFEDPIIHIVGWIFVPLGVLALICGIIRYRAMYLAIPTEHLKVASPSQWDGASRH